MDFADIKNDIAFRKIFGNEQKTAPLISFLNAALQLEGAERVVSVSLANPYQFPRIAGEKATVLDVRATDQSGRKFVVEMQVANKKGFDKRVQYYIARDYSMQIGTGDDYPLLNPAYFIGILDFPFGAGNNYKTHHLMLEKETYEHLLKDIQFAFIELPKFKLDIHELVTPIDRWTYFIKHSTELNIIPDFAQSDEGLNTAFIEADKHNWTTEERIAYDNILIKETDEKQEKIMADEKAHEKGKEEGKEEKEEETIIKLHKKGKIDIEIANLLDLALERVRQIINKNVESGK
jgi:predicted transposase/invertase (TIGR01784 family)